MKTKILTYNSQGTGVVTHDVELSPISEHLFYTVTESSKNNPQEDFLTIFLKVGKIYFEVDTAHRRSLDNETAIQSFETMATDFPGYVDARIQNEEFIPLIFMKVYEQLGRDTAPLIRAREAWNRKKEAEEQERINIQTENAERAAQRGKGQEEERLRGVRQEFAEGKMISGEDFLILCRQNGLELNIRTVGTIRSRVEELNKEGRVCYNTTKGKRKPGLAGCRQAIDDYLAKTSLP